MKYTLILFFLVFITFNSCKESEKNNSTTSSSAEAAFARIDKKNESLFTKEERVRSYQKTVSLSERDKNSTNKKVIYNGYGAAAKEKNLEKNKNEPKQKKKKKYTYKRSSNQHTTSTYATN